MLAGIVYVAAAVLLTGLAGWGDRRLRSPARGGGGNGLVFGAGASGFASFLMFLSWVLLRFGEKRYQGGLERLASDRPTPDWLWQAALGTSIIALVLGVAGLARGVRPVHQPPRLGLAALVGLAINTVVPTVATLSASQNSARWVPLLLLALMPAVIVTVGVMRRRERVDALH